MKLLRSSYFYFFGSYTNILRIGYKPNGLEPLCYIDATRSRQVALFFKVFQNHYKSFLYRLHSILNVYFYIIAPRPYDSTRIESTEFASSGLSDEAHQVDRCRLTSQWDPLAYCLSFLPSPDSYFNVILFPLSTRVISGGKRKNFGVYLWINDVTNVRRWR